MNLKTIYFSLITLLVIAIVVIYLLGLTNTNPTSYQIRESKIITTTQNLEQIEVRGINYTTGEAREIMKRSVVYPEVTTYHNFLGDDFIATSSSDGDATGGSTTPEDTTNNQTQESQTQCITQEDLIIPPENFKIAFIGDSGYGDNFRDVLELIRDENTDLVLHQGDLAYDEGNSESPQLWLNAINSILGEDFPYLFSIGNHDVRHWEDDNGYREILQQKINTLNIAYIGTLEELGTKTAINYNGFLITLLAPGINVDFSGTNHDLFIDQQMRQSPSLWKICSWHKNMRAMQAGGKGNETGWGVYEACRENGAITATGHEHSYSRTYVLSDMSEQTIADNIDPLTIQPRQTFAFVSGLGGASIRDQRIFADYFASVYTSTQNADYGALFIEFNVENNPRKAIGYFKNINGEIVDEFEIENNFIPQCEETQQQNISSSFVYREGANLKLENENFRFIGVNVFGLANDDNIYSCGGNANEGENSNEYLEYLFSYLSQRGINTIRFWAFQSFTNGGTDFSSFDRVISHAEIYNIKLIPVLENQWDECTNSNEKDSNWYSQDYMHPYGEYPLSYKDYIERITTRYKNETAILMWQLINEAESEDSNNEEDPESLYNFALNMSQFIKSVDSNHLVSLGTLGRGQPGTANRDFINLHRIPTIDIVEAHDYGDETEALPSGSNSIEYDLQVAEILNKPFFIGEAGINAGCGGCYTLDERANLFDAKINSSFNAGADGYLIWRWDNLEENFGGSCGAGYCFTESDPLLNIIQRYS